MTDLQRIEQKLDRILAILDPQAKGFEMKQVMSSHLAAIGWQAGKLRIKFKNGELYEYIGVPETMFKEFHISSSQGEYFHQNIKGVFPSQKIDNSTTSELTPSSI